jgi:tetratricopeptide (TPR) repeat protein
MLTEELLFEGDTPLVEGRQRHLRGMFDKEDDKPGAKALYLESRVPDTLIKRITTSPEVQRSLGLQRGRLNDAEWEVFLGNSERIIIRSKQNATYWLALIHYDTSRFDDARDWFDLRCLKASQDEGPWQDGAYYNLGRVYEQLGDLEAARQLYLLDDSPQKHGNLLRARILREQIETRPESTSP